MDEDLKKTEMFDDIRWLPPVASAEELPTVDVRNGDLCVVTEENVIYEFLEGKWSAEMEPDVLLHDE